MMENILIVDDEDSVRRTFVEWLKGAGWPIQVFAVADAEAALVLADKHPIDMAILDWNLGSGSDGLRLLEDLVEFQPELVAILVTGFAQQATPLDALRMGVRDYLDKNQDLTREGFLAAIRKQLDRIIPAKRQRQVNATLAAFRETVGKILPLVRGAAALNDPVPLPDAVRSLFRFLLRSTGAASGVLLVRQVSADGSDRTAAYDADGSSLVTPAIPFSRSLAASIVSFQEPSVMNRFDPSMFGAVELMPFEQGRTSILAAPLQVGPGVHVVFELFDKPEFTEEDRRKASLAAEVGAELLRGALAERQTNHLLFDAVESALTATENFQTLLATGDDTPPPAMVMESLRQGLADASHSNLDSDTGLLVIEAVRALAVRHGPDGVRHCYELVQSTRELLDRVTGHG